MANAIEQRKELTEKEKRFVSLLVDTGCSRKDAAIQMGVRPEYAGQEAYRWFKRAHVQEAYREEVQRKLLSGAGQAAHKMVDLLNAKSQFVQLEAAKELLTRAGFNVEKKQDAQPIGVAVQINLG